MGSGSGDCSFSSSSSRSGIVVVKSGSQVCYRDDSCLYKFSTFSPFPEYRVVVPWCYSNVLCNNHHPLRASC